jgi:predicted MFS family arabinose efflux permease
MQRVLTLYKNAYSGLSPATWWLSVVILINRCGTMVLPFMTLYLTESLGRSLSEAGFVMALWGAGSIFGGIIGGKLTDKIGFYYVQVATLLCGAVMFSILGQLKDYNTICVFTFLLSLLNESFRPANAAAIVHYSKPENRTRSYSLNRLAINLGWSMGGAMGGFIASENYELLFWIDGFSNLAAAVMLWLILAPSKNTATLQKPVKDETILASSPYKDKPYIAFIVLSTLFACCFFQIFSMQPVFYKKKLLIDETGIGWLMAMNGLLIAAFEMIVVHKLEGKRNPLQYVVPGIFLTGLSFAIYNMLPQVAGVALVSMLIITAGEMLALPFMNTFWISRTNANNRGQYAGLYTVAWSTAQVLGPAGGAIIAERWGFDVLWWAVGGVCTVACIGFKLLTDKTATA